MDISLVVCTRNRASQLAKALPYFARLKCEASWELVLVDNGSTDATSVMMAEFAGSAGVNTVLIDEPKVGLSAAHNTGWRQSNGNLVAFTDDDCYPVPDYLDQICRCFTGSDLGYVGGRVLLFDPNDYPITIQPSERHVDIPPHSFISPGMIHGANFAFRREVLERVGGFDERIGPGTPVRSGTDIDILARASAHGFPGAYDPRPVVYHHHGRSKPEDVNRLMENYDVGRGAFYA